MQSFMEIIYIDDEDNGRHTNLRRSAESNAATWAEFNSYRHLDVSSKNARFMLDYHNAKGDLADTINLDEIGFITLIGERPKSDAAYRAIDDEHWAAVRVASSAESSGIRAA